MTKAFELKLYIAKQWLSYKLKMKDHCFFPPQIKKNVTVKLFSKLKQVVK